MRFAWFLAFALAFAAAPAAAQSGPSKCTAAKTKAVGAYAQGLAVCRSKAIAKGVAIDPLCEAKAESKLQKAFEKAERKEDCLETSDLDFVIRQGEDFFANTASVVEANPICCAIGPVCAFTANPSDCSGLDGTIGAPGTVCTGDGSCAAAPAAIGQCCEIDIGNGCVAAVLEGNCTGGGGDFVAGAICEPTGHCRIPK